MAEREYKRLTRAYPRTAFAVVTTSRSSLWLAKDHLLCIDTSGYSEVYKRFFFRDIQALLIRQTHRWTIIALILGALGAVFTSITIVALRSGEAPLAWVMGSMAAVFVLGLAVNLLKGRSCECHIRTAVQTEHLPSLDRLRRARKVLAVLKPLIAQAQGQIAPEELPARMQSWLASGKPAVAAPGTGANYVVDDPNAPPRILS